MQNYFLKYVEISYQLHLKELIAELKLHLNNIDVKFSFPNGSSKEKVHVAAWYNRLISNLKIMVLQEMRMSPIIILIDRQNRGDFLLYFSY